MATKSRRNNQKIIVIILIIAFVVFGIWLLNKYDSPKENNPDKPSQSTNLKEGPITAEGKLVCLPHKDTSGPQTLECAYGLQTDEGKYYAIRESNDLSLINQMGTDKKVKVTGTFRENPTTKYQDIGIITVESFEVLE